MKNNLFILSSELKVVSYLGINKFAGIIGSQHHVSLLNGGNIPWSCLCVDHRARWETSCSRTHWRLCNYKYTIWLLLFKTMSFCSTILSKSQCSILDASLFVFNKKVANSKRYEWTKLYWIHKSRNDVKWLSDSKHHP